MRINTFKFYFRKNNTMVEPYTPVEQVANDLFIPDLRLGLQFATSKYDAAWKLEKETVE